MRPCVPSGAISEGEVKAQIWALLAGGIGVAYVLDQWAGVHAWVARRWWRFADGAASAVA
jgi:4-hydroxybenzoate polyprenyltransferase